METVKRSAVAQGWVEERMTQSTEGFQVSEAPLRGTVTRACSVAQLYAAPPVDRSAPGLPVLHYVP